MSFHIAFISHWNGLISIPPGKCVSSMNEENSDFESTLGMKSHTIPLNISSMWTAVLAPFQGNAPPPIIIQDEVKLINDEKCAKPFWCKLCVCVGLGMFRGVCALSESEWKVEYWTVCWSWHGVPSCLLYYFGKHFKQPEQHVKPQAVGPVPPPWPGP